MAIPNQENLKVKGRNVKIGSWNIQAGINSQFDVETICRDMENYRIKIPILQEKKCVDFSYISQKGTQIIGMTPDPETPRKLYMNRHFLYLGNGRNII